MKRQYLLTIRIDAEDSEPGEYFLDRVAGEDVLDTEILSHDNHVVVEWEEITEKETD